MNTGTEVPGTAHYCVFATGIGPCGVAWSGRGLTRLQLPESDPATTEKRLAAHISGRRTDEPPPFIVLVVDNLGRFAQGASVDCSSVAMNLREVDDLRRDVYATSTGAGPQPTATSRAASEPPMRARSGRPCRATPCL